MMSALPPKADMLSAEIDVCFVPTAELSAELKPTGPPYRPATVMNDFINRPLEAKKKELD